MRQFFLAPPHSENETYAQHFRTAFGFSGLRLVAVAAAVVHAVFPALCPRAASGRAVALHAPMTRRAPL